MEKVNSISDKTDPAWRSLFRNNLESPTLGSGQNTRPSTTFLIKGQKGILIHCIKQTFTENTACIISFFRDEH